MRRDAGLAADVRIPEHVRRHGADTILILAITTADGGIGTLLPPLLRFEGKGPVGIGLLVAVPAVVALLMRVPGGLMYRASRARMLLLGPLMMCALADVLYPLTANGWLLAAIGALYGTGFSAATTVNLASVIESIGPGEDRGRVLGLYASGMSSGYAISATMWGFIADHAGFGVAFPAMAAFWALAIALVLLLVHPPLASASQAATRPSGVSPWRRAQSFGSVLVDPVVVFVVLGAFFLNIFLSQFNTFLPLTLLAAGLSLSQIGGIRSLWSATNALGRAFGGPVLALMDFRRTQDASLILQAAMLALFAFQLPYAVLGVITVLGASGRAICYVANAVALAEVDPSKVSRGMASGVLNAAGDLGRILGPVSGGFIARAAGLHTFWLIAPPLYLAIYFGILQIVRRRPQVQPATVAV